MNMRVGLPKGRLLPVSERVLRQLRLNPGKGSLCRIANADLTVWLLKMCDIPKLVGAGELDVGLAPTEWVEEVGDGCETLANGNGYAVRVSILGQPGWRGQLRDVNSLRVATEYPNLARRHLGGRARELSVVEIHGSAEAYPPELADVVLDCVETGATAEEHGLVEVERLFDCGLHVIAGTASGTEQRRVAERIGEVVGR
jgi:ATP phosphoribosyltransferase